MSDPDLKYRVRIVYVDGSSHESRRIGEQKIASLLDQGYVIQGMSNASEFTFAMDGSYTIVTVLLVKAPPF